MLRVEGKRYYPLLDACRLGAAVAIVWLHIAGEPSLEWTKVVGRFAVPFFASAAVFLACDASRRRPDTTTFRYFLTRFLRIYLLFLAWSGIYLVARDTSSLLFEHRGWIRFTAREFFLDGIAIQLWFLPFIIAATTAAFGMSRWIHSHHKWRFPAVGICAVSGFCIAILPVPPPVQSAGYLFGLSYDASPACFWGIALGLMNDLNTRKRLTADQKTLKDGFPRRSLLWHLLPKIAGAAFFSIWLLLALSNGRSLLWENIAGFGLLLLALNEVSTRPNHLLLVAGSYSLGIYLAHALFVEGLQHLLPKLGVPGCVLRDLLIFALSVLGSCLFIFLVRRGGRRIAWLAG